MNFVSFGKHLTLPALSAFFFAIPSEAIGRSVLERLLVSIAQEHANANWNIKANIAENSGNIGSRPRVLAPGDQVVIGYNASGDPVSAIADKHGVVVTQSQADTMQSGLGAGIYAPGSLLYALPPSARLSLYQATEIGRALSAAQELLVTWIDGRIKNRMYSNLPANLVEVASISSVLNFADFGNLTSTALGAVNTGEIVSSVQAEFTVEPIGIQVELLKAEIGQGPNASIDVAVTNSLYAVSSRTAELGASSDPSVFILNLAANEMNVSAAIENQVSGISFSVRSLVSTAIGAINAGVVGR